MEHPSRVVLVVEGWFERACGLLEAGTWLLYCRSGDFRCEMFMWYYGEERCQLGCPVFFLRIRSAPFSSSISLLARYDVSGYLSIWGRKLSQTHHYFKVFTAIYVFSYSQPRGHFTRGSSCIFLQYIMLYEQLCFKDAFAGYLLLLLHDVNDTRHAQWCTTYSRKVCSEVPSLLLYITKLTTSKHHHNPSILKDKHTMTNFLWDCWDLS